jgi:hypothetical protein
MISSYPLFNILVLVKISFSHDAHGYISVVAKIYVHIIDYHNDDMFSPFMYY